MSEKDDEDVDSKNDEVDDTENQGDDVETGSVDEQKQDNDKGSGDDHDDDQVDDEAGDDVGDDATADELREKLQKTQENNTKLFKRAKKAEGFVEKKDPKTGKMVWVKKDAKPEDKKTVDKPNKKEKGLSTDDVYTLISAGVPREDVQEVKDYADMKGISIDDALKSTVVQTILNERKEERKTADATNTGSSRSGNQSKSGKTLLERASKTGELPDSADDMTKLAESRLVKK